MPRKRILVVYLGEVANVARVRRHVDFLAAEYDVTLAAMGAAPSLPANVEYLELPPPAPADLVRRAESVARLIARRAGRYEAAFWRDRDVRAWRARLEHALPVDLILVNHLFALPLADALAGRTPVVFDAHEHWTSESASWTLRQRISMRGAHEWILERFVPRTAAVLTVSAGIAREFRERVGVTPVVVTNAPFFAPLKPTDVHDPIRLLHFGMADPRRRLEDTIAAVRSLGDRFSLDLVLARENEYRRRLEGIASGHDRVRVLPPVPSDELLRFANDYDVGVFLLPARFPNQLHVLPNKLFDYIQARLAVAIGPSPEMASIVSEWDCGVVSESFAPESFARALDRLTVPEIRRMKANSDSAAAALNAESNREAVLAVVRNALRPDAS